MKSAIFCFVTLLFCLVFDAPLVSAASGTTDMTWYGHSAFRVKTPSGKVLLIDPWITNPSNPNAKKDLENIGNVDLILITHGHTDHIGNAADIAKKSGAKLVATSDLMRSMVRYAGFPEKQADRSAAGNFGGEIQLLDGDVTVRFVPAVHGGGMDPLKPVVVAAVEKQQKGAKKKDGKKKTAKSDKPKQPSVASPGQVYGGPPGGFLVTIKNGPRIYYTGDTDFFGDMGLLSDIDILMICIGDRFTMGPRLAARAVRLLMPKMAIPMHYGTFPALTGTSELFAKELELLNLTRLLKQMKIGETLVWK